MGIRDVFFPKVKSSDWRKRLEGIAELADPIPDQLALALTRDSVPEVRAAALYRLGPLLGNAEVRRVILWTMEHENVDTVSAASAFALGEAPSDGGTPTRQEIVVALGKAADSHHMPLCHAAASSLAWLFSDRMASKDPIMACTGPVEQLGIPFDRLRNLIRKGTDWNAPISDRCEALVAYFARASLQKRGN